jgi:hypothetical protein
MRSLPSWPNTPRPWARRLARPGAGRASHDARGRVRLSAGEVGDPEALRASIDREILEKVRAYAVVEDVVGSESIAGVITEYPIPLVPGPARTPLKRGDAKRRK